MEKYIDKSDLVAEIERLKNTSLKYGYNTMQKVLVDSGKDISLRQLQNFLDTLEVKEVDLEKELESWRHNHFHGRRDKEASGEYLERITQFELAKHFFQLGMAVNNNAQKGEEV